MSSLMIRCPTTGRAVPTAIETEPDDFRKLPNVSGRMACPACGQEHVWAVRSAWLDGAPRLLEATAAPPLAPGSKAA